MAASLAIMVTLASGPADAAPPRPSAAAAKKELEKLNAKIDQIVNQYDKAVAELDGAKKQLKVLQREVAAEQVRYNALHTRVAQLAAEKYKTGGGDEATTVVAAKNPEAALEQMSTFEQLATNRSQELRAFVASTQRLHRDLAAVQATVQNIQQQTASLKQQKAALKKEIAKQTALARQAGESGSPGGPLGGSYTGPASGSARAALNYAFAQRGKPYQFGGTGPDGYDCSGLVMMSWRAGGVSLPRVVPDQYNATHRVSRADLRPGDIVFFDNLGHDGLYVGGGQFIHAPRTGRTITVESLAGYWDAHFVGGGRP